MYCHCTISRRWAREPRSPGCSRRRRRGARDACAGRLSDQIGAQGLVRGGAIVALLGAVAAASLVAGSGPMWLALAGLVIGLGLGFVGAPTMGSLYRNLPAHLVP